MKSIRNLASTFAIGVSLAQPAFGQSAQQDGQSAQRDAGVAEIVVTAQKRSENIQTVPITISALTSDALQERAVTSVSGVSNIAPNVSLDAGTPFSGSTSSLTAFIRGIGANDFAFNLDPGVGVYIDGVYLARSVGANQELGDIARIEVLKGPQGTLFGRNTIGGAISIVTRDPGSDFSFNGDVTTGSYNLMQARGSADLPIADSLSSSISFQVKHRRGYLKRLEYPGAFQFVTDPLTAFASPSGYDGTGQGREGGDQNWTARAKLKWAGSGPIAITLSGDYTYVDQEAAPTTLVQTFPTTGIPGSYNCAIEGIGSAGCTGSLPPEVFLLPRASKTSLFGLPPFFGVNIDADPTNDRLPLDDRFVTSDIDTSYSTGANFSKMRTRGLAGIIDYDIGEDTALKSITAYRDIRWKVGIDVDGTPINWLENFNSMRQKQFGQELQLVGSLDEGKLKYVLGAYYFRESGREYDAIVIGPFAIQIDSLNQFVTKNVAAFAQVDWRPNDLFGITVGGRYTHEKKTFDGTHLELNGLTYKILNLFGVPGCESLVPISPECQAAAGFFVPGEPFQLSVDGENRRNFNNFSPKVGVQLYPADRVMLYGSWSRGYKTGGWTVRISSPVATAPSFDEEEAETFEVGVKSTLLDRRLQLNAAAFTTSYTGIQLNFQEGISPTIKNAGSARIKGAEVEAVASLSRALLINASVGYLDSKYTSVEGPASVAPSALQLGVFPGAGLPKAPKWKFNISPRYEFDLAQSGNIVLIADYTHTSSMRTDTEGTIPIIRQPTDLLNLSATYEAPSGSWSLTVGGTNVTDERYVVNGGLQGPDAAGIVYASYNRPAEWYARLGVKF